MEIPESTAQDVGANTEDVGRPITVTAGRLAMGSIHDIIEANRIFGVILRNIEIFMNAKRIGFEYLLNPETGKLHRVTSDFIDSHNLHTADLENWIGLTNIGLLDVHDFPEGTEVPVYDLHSGNLLGNYAIDKCEHCEW